MKLIEFLSTDNLNLPGLLYEPDKATKKVAIWLHGCGSASVFYSVERSNIMGETLNDNNIAYLTFNNRGAHILKTLKKYNKDTDTTDSLMYGTAMEKIADCVFDIDGAIKFLEKLGYEEFYLLGHSTGANKVCVYDHLKQKNNIKKYVLFGGGDDTGSYYRSLGKKKFELALTKCKNAISKDKSSNFVPKNIVDEIYSYGALFDVINPDGDYNCFPYFEQFSNTKLSSLELFRYFRAIQKPSLVVYGENDEFCYPNANECLKFLKQLKHNSKNFDFKILKDADHSASGLYKDLANLIAQWLIS